ncbi:hypothetical protein COCC4DRAFT_34067 [Bipolaris maydis ATCC 48331]|nr:uncharacterized protein COCC4DRAFT_34067 [Bipolaris maydis ATCC 48331]ENI01165.1 hypothetical protein COCC4DRAFT_34067 [Bipolaris maydis ATCC 48331]
MPRPMVSSALVAHTAGMASTRPLGHGEMPVQVHAMPAPRTCWLLLSAAVIFARGFGPRRALSSPIPNQGRVLDTGWWFKEAYQVAITSQMLWGSGLNPLGL